jgi:hypothetical protein
MNAPPHSHVPIHQEVSDDRTVCRTSPDLSTVAVTTGSASDAADAPLAGIADENWPRRADLIWPHP